MKAALAVVCQESESPRTAPIIMNAPPASPPAAAPLTIVKEALNNCKTGAPTLNTWYKEVLSCATIRRGDVCIALTLSTVYQVRAATSTISALATSIMKTTAQLSVAVCMESKSSKTPPPIVNARPSLKVLPSLIVVRKRMPSLIIKCSAHSMRLLKTFSQRILPPMVGAKKDDGFYLFGCSAVVVTSCSIARDRVSCESKPTLMPTIKASIWACPNVKSRKCNFLSCAMTTASAHTHWRIICEYCQVGLNPQNRNNVQSIHSAIVINNILV